VYLAHNLAQHAAEIATIARLFLFSSGEAEGAYTQIPYRTAGRVRRAAWEPNNKKGSLLILALMAATILTGCGSERFGQCDSTNAPNSNCYQKQGPPYRNGCSRMLPSVQTNELIAVTEKLLQIGHADFIPGHTQKPRQSHEAARLISEPQCLHLVAAGLRSSDKHAGQVLVGGESPNTVLPCRAITPL
jgi:hypothetical protein